MRYCSTVRELDVQTLMGKAFNGELIVSMKFQRWEGGMAEAK